MTNRNEWKRGSIWARKFGKLFVVLTWLSSNSCFNNCLPCACITLTNGRDLLITAGSLERNVSRGHKDIPGLLVFGPSAKSLDKFSLKIPYGQFRIYQEGTLVIATSAAVGESDRQFWPDYRKTYHACFYPPDPRHPPVPGTIYFLSPPLS